VTSRSPELVLDSSSTSSSSRRCSSKSASSSSSSTRSSSLLPMRNEVRDCSALLRFRKCAWRGRKSFGSEPEPEIVWKCVWRGRKSSADRRGPNGDRSAVVVDPPILGSRDVSAATILRRRPPLDITGLEWRRTSILTTVCPSRVSDPEVKSSTCSKGHQALTDLSNEWRRTRTHTHPPTIVCPGKASGSTG